MVGPRRTQHIPNTWKDGRYHLVSEVLVFEGHAVAATRRPGAALPNAHEKPGSRYRDALRLAQRRGAISGNSVLLTTRWLSHSPVFL